MKRTRENRKRRTWKTERKRIESRLHPVRASKASRSAMSTGGHTSCSLRGSVHRKQSARNSECLAPPCSRRGISMRSTTRNWPGSRERTKRRHHEGPGTAPREIDPARGRCRRLPRHSRGGSASRSGQGARLARLPRHETHDPAYRVGASAPWRPRSRAPGVFRFAIVKGTARIVVVHNHPSGDVEPSAEDRALTTRLAEAGRIIGIELLDHIIIGLPDSYRSLKQDGLREAA